MGLKNWPYWLKGGLLATIAPFILIKLYQLIYILGLSLNGALQEGMFLRWITSLATYFISITFILLFLAGSSMGFIYGSFKNSKPSWYGLGLKLASILSLYNLFILFLLFICKESDCIGIFLFGYLSGFLFLDILISNLPGLENSSLIYGMFFKIIVLLVMTIIYFLIGVIISLVKKRTTDYQSSIPKTS